MNLDRRHFLSSASVLTGAVALGQASTALAPLLHPLHHMHSIASGYRCPDDRPGIGAPLRDTNPSGTSSCRSEREDHSGEKLNKTGRQLPIV